MYYDYTIHAYIYKTGLLEEYDKEETVEVTVDATIWCLQRRLYSTMFYPISRIRSVGRQLNEKYPVNISHRSRIV